jgi:hypothetical protein
MNRFLKPLCLLAVIAYTVLFPAFPPEVQRPILSVCVTLVVEYVAASTGAVFIKRCTTATGFG